MQLRIYSVRDELVQDSSILLTAKNDEDLYRQIKLVMCNPTRDNFFLMNPKDKRVIFIGQLETTTGVITSEPNVILLKGLEEIRLELVDEANAAKAQVIDSAIKNGLDKEKAQAYMNLLVSLDFFGIKTPNEEKLEELVDKKDKQIKNLQSKLSKIMEVKNGIEA